MKKFIGIKFGINNFDEKWYDWRLDYLEDIFLDNFESNATNEVYYIILWHRLIPLSVKQRINKLINNYSRWYILEADCYGDMKRLYDQFVLEHTEKDEMIIQSRMDADDLYATGIFTFLEKESEKYIQEHDSFLISIEGGYRFLIEQKKSYACDRRCRQASNFLFTKNRKLSVWEASHEKISKYLLEKYNIPTYFVSCQNRRMWLELQTSDNTDNIMTGINLYDKMLAESDRNINYNNDILSGEFSINNNKLNNFYDKYPKIPNVNFGLVYKNPLVDCMLKVRKEYTLILNAYVEMLTQSKHELRAWEELTKKIEEKISGNYLQSVNFILGVPTDNYSLFNIESFDLFMKKLFAKYNKFCFVLVSNNLKDSYDSLSYIVDRFNIELDITRKNILLIFNQENVIKKLQEDKPIESKQEIHDNFCKFYVSNNMEIDIGKSQTVANYDNINYSLNLPGINCVLFVDDKIADCFNVNNKGVITRKI